MDAESTALDQLQHAYKVAVETGLQQSAEKRLLPPETIQFAEVDSWEHAFFEQQQAGDKARQAKRTYEDALRRKFFNF